MTAKGRFWAKVRKSSGCWEWTASTDTGGYGHFRIGSAVNGTSRMVKAHRFSWSLTRGKIPKGWSVLHKCDNTLCVRPGHLFLGTQTDNMQDRKAKQRGNHPVGSRHGRAKLTEADVLAIRERYASLNWTQVQLAAEYGVSQPLIGHIVRRVTWRHI